MEIKKFGSFLINESQNNYTDKQVLSMIVDAVMTAMGDEWVPQEDDNFKSFLESHGLLDLFNQEY